jgi:hypothetical protein
MLDDNAPPGPTPSGVGDSPFGPPADPARVARLAPGDRALCTQLAARMDECWDAFLATVAGEVELDDSARAMMDGMRPHVRAGMENLCLGAALDDPNAFGDMQAARACFALPCNEMVDCIMRLQGP